MLSFMFPDRKGEPVFLPCQAPGWSIASGGHVTSKRTSFSDHLKQFYILFLLVFKGQAATTGENELVSGLQAFSPASLLLQD